MMSVGTITLTKDTNMNECQINAVADSTKAELKTFARENDLQIICYCGEAAKDGSCYCQACEDEIYADA